MILSEMLMITGISFYVFPSLGIIGFLISTFFLGLGGASYAPIAMALVSDLAPERPEDAVGFLLTGISLARIPASLLTGVLIAIYSYKVAFSFTAFCFFIVAIGLLIDYLHVRSSGGEINNLL
jgi:MFS family permease